MSLVEAELRQQHGLACQLVVASQAARSGGVHHQEHIQVVGIVAQHHFLGGGGAKVVSSRLEGMKQYAVACCAPEEGCRARDASVGPVVGVDNLYHLSPVRESAVLHASAVEAFLRGAQEAQGGAAAFDADGSRFGEDFVGAFLPIVLKGFVPRCHQARLLVKRQLHSQRTDSKALNLQPKLVAHPTRVVNQYLRFGLCLRVTQRAT